MHPSALSTFISRPLRYATPPPFTIRVVFLSGSRRNVDVYWQCKGHIRENTLRIELRIAHQRPALDCRLLKTGLVAGVNERPFVLLCSQWNFSCFFEFHLSHLGLIAHRLMTTPLRREEAETYFSSSSEEQQESVSLS